MRSVYSISKNIARIILNSGVHPSKRMLKIGEGSEKSQKRIEV